MLGAYQRASTFPFIEPGTNLVGTDQISALRGCVTLLDFCPDFAAVLGQPSFLLVEQGNGALHKLIHGLVGPALDVLLDHFFQRRPQMNLHTHILHHPCPEGRKGESPAQPTAVSRVWRVCPTRFQPLCARYDAISRISPCQSKQPPCYLAASKPLTGNH